MAAVTWYLRSLGDRDTHRGELRPTSGKVHAECGAVFTPPQYLRGGLPGAPPDPQQVCTACRRVEQ
ncbi:MAG: hypothetical protein ABIZ05_10600 [Pseudonocardiaceae bacterium]